MASTGYESWFLSARDPKGERALWLRRTLHRGRRGEPVVGVWVTTFAPTAACLKQLLPPGLEARTVLAVADGFIGRVTMDGFRAAWSLHVTPSEPAVRPLRPRLLYHAPLPRTKTELPVPDGLVTGHLDLDGDRWDVHGWPVAVGHNWGREHADRWIWIHAALPGGPLRWVDLVLARVRVGGRLTPWLAVGTARLGTRLVPLGGIGRRALVTSDPAGTGVSATVAVPGGTLGVQATAAPDVPARLLYRDPAGGTRHVVHAGAADLEARLRSGDGRAATFTGRRTAAFEIGAREEPAGFTPAALPLED